ncbi:hypothetical protein [Advenella kashmirensis]|nr:hypothetical protein [Advenella kashmirensis]
MGNIQSVASGMAVAAVRLKRIPQLIRKHQYDPFAFALLLLDFDKRIGESGQIMGLNVPGVLSELRRLMVNGVVKSAGVHVLRAGLFECVIGNRDDDLNTEAEYSPCGKSRNQPISIKFHFAANGSWIILEKSLIYINN